MNTKLWKGIFWGLILVLPFWLWVGSQAWGYTETFYVCEGGNGTLPETNACATAYDAADFNTAGNWDTDDSDDGKIGPNDLVEVMDDGGIIRAQLTVQQSGLSGKPITIAAQSGDSPVISGADLVSTWTNAGMGTFSDNFDDNDITDWSVTGTALGQNERVEVTIDGSDYASTSISAATEMWATFKVYSSNVSIPNNNEKVVGSGLYSGSVVRATWGWKNDGGTVKWYFETKNDGGSLTSSVSATSTAAAWYDVKLHWKAATGIGANDGIIQVWHDGSLVVDISNIDTDTQTVNALILGCTWENTSSTLTAYYDNASYGINGWEAACTTEPEIVYFDTTRGTKESDFISIDTTNEWFWAGNILYVYSTSDPDTAYTTPGIQAGIRSACIAIADVDYINFENISLQNSNANGITFSNVNYSIIDNVDISGMFYDGLNMPYTVNDSTNITYKNSELSYNGASGLNFGLRALDTILIQSNVVHHNCWNNDGTAESNYAAGIKAWGGLGGSPVADNIIIEYNQSYANNGITNSRGNGIWVDEWGTGAVIRYNQTYDNYGNGILVEYMDSAQVYCNLSWDNGVALGGQMDHGIHLDRSASSNVIYNNVCYSNVGGGINVSGRAGANSMINNLVKNNIGIDNGTEFIAAFGGENAGDGSGNVYIYNCFGLEEANFIEWGDGVYKSTYDAWETAYGSGTNSVESDPLFTNAAGDDFTLKPNSPCRHGAVYIPGYTTKLRPETSWPDDVVTMEDILSIGAYGIYRGSAGY